MGGRNIRLLEFTDFDFTSSLKGLGQTTIWLAKNIPTAGYRNGQLIVRFRSINFGNGSTQVTFSLVGVAPTKEDPSAFYRNLGKTYPGTGMGPAGIINSSGLMYSKELTTDSDPLPSFMSLQMVVYQPVLSSALTFTVNADLALKE